MKSYTVIIFVLFFSNVLHAASFDCKKAGTEIEKTICSDSTLSKLDSDLSEKYKLLLKELSLENMIILKNSQRVWLKERNKITGSASIAQFYKLRIHSLSHQDVKYESSDTSRHHKIEYVTTSKIPSEIMPYNLNNLIKDTIINKFFIAGPEKYADRFAGATIDEHNTFVMFEVNDTKDGVYYLLAATHDNGRPMKAFQIAKFIISKDGSYVTEYAF